MQEIEVDVDPSDGFVYSDPVAQRLDAIDSMAKGFASMKDRQAKALCLEAMQVAISTMRPKGQPASVSAIAAWASRSPDLRLRASRTGGTGNHRR